MKTNIKSFKFKNKKNGLKYGIDFNLNNIALLEDNLEIEINGWIKYGKGDKVEVIYVVKYDPESNRLYVSHEDKVLWAINLNRDLEFDDAFDDLNSKDAFDKIAQDVEDVYDGVMDSSEAVDLVIQRIPSGDPLLGCLIKSALSTSIVQIIRCHNKASRSNNNLRSINSNRKKLKLILKCLGKKKWAMLSTFALRAARCMLSFGLDIF